MKEYDKQIEKRLEVLGDILRLQPPITKNGMRKIEHMEQAKPFESVTLIPTLVKSGLGLAACLLIGMLLWFSITWPTSITLADVEKSIDSQKWVHISYEDGTKEWANLDEKLCFYTYKNPHNFYVGMRDHVNGIWRAYHSNWGQQIHEETFSVRPYPQTPWEYAVGDWDDRGISQFSNKTIEKSTDTIDGRKVVRFDTYNVGPLGIRSLAQQVWANPETRLPIRIRKYSRPDKFKTGDFSFPEVGPSSIYDLNAPQGLKVVKNWGIIEPAARTIVDAAKQARQQLPDKMCIIKKSKYYLDIYYRSDNMLRHEIYSAADENGPLPIEPPETYEHIREWAMDNLNLIRLHIYDGEYEYDFDKAPWNPEAKMHVEYLSNDLIYVLMRISEQWSYINNVGPMKVLEGEPGTPPGCVLLRFEGSDMRRDWYVDLKRDYICVKQLQFRRDQDTDQLKREKHWEAERTDLTRLASGQWYARTIKNQEEIVAEYDVKLLTDVELENLAGKEDSEGFFGGKKLLKNAMDNGINVTFWAR